MREPVKKEHNTRGNDKVRYVLHINVERKQLNNELCKKLEIVYQKINLISRYTFTLS